MSENLPQRPEDSFNIDLKKKRTLLDRFVDRIWSSFQFFQNKPQTDVHLAGRIQDLKKTADLVLSQLQNTREDLKREVDAELFKFVEAVVDPLTKDVQRIEKSMEKQASMAQQANAFQKYAQWIEKAKIWVQICSRTTDKEMIKKAVLRQSIEECLQVVERDLQIIEDYKVHMVENAPGESSIKTALIQKIDEKISPYIASLIALKNHPEHLNLMQVSDWKNNLDKRREKYFDGALHAIDKIISRINPSSESEESHEHLVEIISQIVYLEEEIPELRQVVETMNLSDEMQKEILFSTFLSLEQEVHKLNLDLRLTPEMIERLRRLMRILEEIYARISQA